ncbi:MAG TPA: Calx-beta domain-containing protein [Abditibacteriaceae bacterium]
MMPAQVSPEQKQTPVVKELTIKSESSYPSDITVLVNWIFSLQYKNTAMPNSYGALKFDKGPGAKVNGVPYYRVKPYFGNQAMLGMLRTRKPGAVVVAKRWIKWYFNHLRSPDTLTPGVPYQYWYKADGSGETSCIVPDGVTQADLPFYCDYNDGTESGISTFFAVLWATYQANGRDFLTAEEKIHVRNLANVLIALRQSDGLFWTKEDYQIKYLEGQCEVFDGLRALSNLELSVFRNSLKSEEYRLAAQELQEDILRELYDPASGLYIPSKNGDGTFNPANLGNWYPDSQAQAWPHLFGVVTPNDPKTVFVMNAINQRWNWDTAPETIDQGFINASHAYAALLRGDTQRVNTYLAKVKQLKFPDFPPLFSIADAGWLLASLTRLSPLAVLTIDDLSITEGNTGTADASFTIRLSSPSNETVTVNAIPANGSALLPADYTGNGATLSFAPGETSKTFSVPVQGDLLDEPDELFYVLLFAPTNAIIARGRGVCTIQDDDATPTISIDDLTIGEGNSGQRTAALRLKLSAPSGQGVRVSYATANGTAVGGNDYVAVAPTVIAFNTNSLYAYARVLLNGDLLNEQNETFLVNLSSPANATIADNQATGTILNDDSVPGLSINDVSISEGNSGSKQLTFTVTLSKASGQTVSVNYATADGIARSTSDYAAKSGTLSFAPGSALTRTISITINGDTQIEGNETLYILLSSAANASIGRGRGVGVIINDDASDGG